MHRKQTINLNNRQCCAKVLSQPPCFFTIFCFQGVRLFFKRLSDAVQSFCFSRALILFSPEPDRFLRNIYFFKIQTYVAADRQLSKEIKLYLLRLFKVTICQKTEFKNQWQQVLWSDEGKCFWFRSLCTEEVRRTVQHWV